MYHEMLSKKAEGEVSRESEKGGTGEREGCSMSRCVGGGEHLFDAKEMSAAAAAAVSKCLPFFSP